MGGKNGSSTLSSDNVDSDHQSLVVELKRKRKVGEEGGSKRRKGITDWTNGRNEWFRKEKEEIEIKGERVDKRVESMKAIIYKVEEGGAAEEEKKGKRKKGRWDEERKKDSKGGINKLKKRKNRKKRIQRNEEGV